MPLADESEIAGMWVSIARALDLSSEHHTVEGVKSRLASKASLVALDNLEQLPEAQLAIDELLAAAAGLVVVATSRSPVQVVGEYVHPVPPLLLPLLGGSPSEIADADAVKMFVASARRAAPGFAVTAENADAVARLCHKLDGLPLALEIVAARVRLLSPAAILSRLGQSLDLASTGAATARPPAHVAADDRLELPSPRP